MGSISSMSCKLLSKTFYIVLHGLKFSRAFTLLFNFLFLLFMAWKNICHFDIVVERKTIKVRKECSREG